MRERFEKELRESGYVHMLLKPDHTRSVEARLLRKPVEASRPLWDGQDITRWSKSGVGDIELHGRALRLVAPARLEPTLPMPHYTGFSSVTAALDLPGQDWQAYNRVVCRVRPACDGFHKPFLTINLRNDGLRKVPDEYQREGFHVINLENDRDNECVWEFPDLPRDKVVELSFSLNCHGNERFAAEDFVFDVFDIRLERVSEPDVSLGWQGNRGTISHSTTGYWLHGAKVAVAQGVSGSFELLREEDDTVVFRGEARPLENEKGSFGILDFTAFATPGRYRLRLGGVTTESFAIDERVMQEAAWKVVNYLYAERCGYPVGGGHTSCHGDITATHDGKTIPYWGGWHDAGDVSQQTVQSAEVVQALLELAGVVGDDTALRRRLIEEARWGLDFVLKTRFGDGYRAFSVGMSRWTDGVFNTHDDERARVHNRSIDNILCAGVQACAAQALRGEDPELAWVCQRTAREDFAFGLARFGEVGLEPGEVMEHTHNASLSLFYAAAAWAAAQLLRATGEDGYTAEVERWMARLLACQDRGEAGLAIDGFFYRDENKGTIVHFNHQSREHLFAQAMAAACEVLTTHPAQPTWRAALAHYGAYLKALHAHAAPYGMLPAGVHAFDEADDADTFALLHVYTNYEAEREHYQAQLSSGVPLGSKHCLRHFPVWFSFRGNTAVMLSAGKAASIAGRALGDEALLEMARDQLYWVAGRNPFGQSLMYGEGSNYAQQYAALCGETTGELPVGVQTHADEDRPYWPMANNATYKEIWTTTAGHWLRLAADLYQG